MAQTAKTFHAAKAFGCAGFHYESGDVVSEPIVIATVLVYGEQFITADTRRTRKVAEDPTPTEPEIEGA